MLYAVIMAGGSGTRFWPQSRKSKPKQLLSLTGSRTMIRATVERILPLIDFERIVVVTAVAHAEKIREELPELRPDMIVSEPRGRNTAACVAVAAYKLSKIDPTAVMAVLPADHVIKNERAFREAVAVAERAASSGDHLLTFGIRPNRPETGYGYIKLGNPTLEIESKTVFWVERFVEKPDRATAEEYVASGNFLWNSGMFIWKVQAIIEAFREHLPSLSQAMERIAPALHTADEPKAIAQAYEVIEGISIDYGIMEKASNVLTLPIDVDWNDVGSWTSLQDLWKQDESGNAATGNVLILDGRRCIVSSPEKVTAIIGAEDLIVVDTPDALLVCHKDRAQDVRELQRLLVERGYESLL